MVEWKAADLLHAQTGESFTRQSLWNDHLRLERAFADRELGGGVAQPQLPELAPPGAPRYPVTCFLILLKVKRTYSVNTSRQPLGIPLARIARPTACSVP